MSLSRSELQRINDWVKESTHDPLLPQSRIHLLPSLASASVYIKREDESSSGISGGKLRKYAGLLPILKQRGVQEVAIIGGANSNNVAGILQLLKEWDIQSWLFLRQAAGDAVQGNQLWIQMLCTEDHIHWVSRTEWPRVENIAESFLENRRQSGINAVLIPEGALCEEALPGSLTLAWDVLRNEAESGCYFERLFIDSGTGMSAIGLLLGLSLFDESVENRQVVITLIAGNKEEFLQNLDRFEQLIQDKLESTVWQRPRLEFIDPPTCRSFGSTNTTLFKQTLEIARNEGILMDPVYSVKHYMSMRSYLSAYETSGNSLFIFNGSALGLAGFQEQLSRQKGSESIG